MSAFVEKSGKAPDAPPKEEAQHGMTAQKQQEAAEKPAVAPQQRPKFPIGIKPLLMLSFPAGKLTLAKHS